MDISKIYSKSWAITKKYKILWFFGAILIVFVGGGLGFNFPGGGGGSSNRNELSNLPSNQASTSASLVSNNISSTNPDHVFQTLTILFSNVSPIVWIMLIIGLILLVILSVCISYAGRSWIVGAFLSGIDMAIDDKQFSVEEVSKRGFRSFKSILWLLVVPGLVYALYVLALSVVMFLVVLLANSLGNNGLQILMIFLGSLIFIALVFIPSLFLAATQIWSFRIAALEGVSGKEALKSGFTMARKNLGNMFLLGTVNSLTGAGFGCLSFMAIGVVGVVFVLLSIALLAINQLLGIVVISVLATVALTLLSAAVFIVGAYNVFNYSTWTVWYRDLKNQQLTNQTI